MRTQSLIDAHQCVSYPRVHSRDVLKALKADGWKAVAQKG